MEGEGRRTEVKINYEKKDISKNVKPFVQSVEYIDTAEGGSDELTMTLDNTDMRFLGKAKPIKGSTLSATIIMHDWDKEGISESFRTGEMIIDDLTAEEPPSIFTVKAVSQPAAKEFKNTTRHKTYKNATIQTIAAKIAKRADVALHYEADKIKIKEIEQSKEADADFLLDLCEEYGLGVKIYNKKIVIFDEEAYEKKAPVATIFRMDSNEKVGKTVKKMGGVEKWEWNTTLQATYTGASVTYTDSSNNKKHKAKVGKKGRQLKLNLSAFSKKDAQLKAKAALHKENKKRTTMTITMQADPRIMATSTVKLVGFRKGNGKYYVDEVVHNIGSGYTIDVTLHKVMEEGNK